LAWAAVVGAAINHGISAQAVGGTAASVNLMKKGENHLGMGNTYDVFLGARGLKHFKDLGKSNLRAMFVAYDMRIGIWTRAAAGVKDFPDLKGKRCYFDLPPAPILAHSAEVQLDAYGMTFDDIDLRKWSGWSELKAGVAEGTVDASDAPLMLGPAPHPTLYEISLTTDILIPSMTKEAQAFVSKKYPYFSPGVIPAGLYPKQDTDLNVLSLPQMYFCNADLPEDMIYELVKATWENMELLIKTNKGFKGTTEDLLTKGFVVPYHPGAVKYYKEADMWTSQLDSMQNQVLAELGTK